MTPVRQAVVLSDIYLVNVLSSCDYTSVPAALKWTGIGTFCQHKQKQSGFIFRIPAVALPCVISSPFLQPLSVYHLPS